MLHRRLQKIDRFRNCGDTNEKRKVEVATVYISLNLALYADAKFSDENRDTIWSWLNTAHVSKALIPSAITILAKNTRILPITTIIT